MDYRAMNVPVATLKREGNRFAITATKPCPRICREGYISA